MSEIDLGKKDAELEAVLAKLGIYDLSEQAQIMAKLGIEPKDSSEKIADDKEIV